MHTKGPWRPDGYDVLAGNDYLRVANCRTIDDARFIALAPMLPELVEALEAVKYENDRATNNGRDYLVCRQAMDKVCSVLAHYHSQAQTEPAPGHEPSDPEERKP